MVKASKKTAAKKAGAQKSSVKSAKSKIKGAGLLKSLPESVEHIEIVQQVAGVLEELQSRVLDVKEEASKELKKLMKRYESNYKNLEKKVHKVTSDAKKQAQTSMIQLLQKWHEHKDKLPKPMAREIEKILEQIGTRVIASKPKAKKATSVKPTVPKAAKKKAVPKKKKAASTKLKTKSAASKRTTAPTDVSEEKESEF